MQWPENAFAKALLKYSEFIYSFTQSTFTHLKMKEPEVLSRRKIFDGFFALEEIELKNEAGGERLLRHLVVPKKAVAVLVYNKDNGHVIFSKQYRLAAK